MNTSFSIGGSLNSGGLDRSSFNLDSTTTSNQTPKESAEVNASVTKGSNDATSIQTMDELQKFLSTGQNVSVGEQHRIKDMDRAIKAVQGSSVSLEYSVHKETQEIMVKVLNKETGEVIREVPPEKMLDMVAKLMENAGIIVDERR
jgi:flagellar protein FlaG